MIDKKTNPPGAAIDEALWTAYRCDDKAAVTDYLFRRSLVGTGCPRSFPHPAIKDRVKEGHAAKRARSERMPINDGARQISSRSALN
jgi:hypothetical protein